MDGILPLWKERGMTSHDCVFKLRKILQTKKVGHGGTLDPDVDGVLPICIGKGTKVIEYLQDSGKVYEGEVTLGFATTTEDASGETVSVTPVVTPPTAADIDAAMASMVGRITQVPPLYSAVKVKGKRLYEYARAGIEVERPQREATIVSFTRTSEPLFSAETGLCTWRFKVECGPGTYVRTLAVDTGLKLGYAAHMSDLTRTASGGFTQEQALTLAQVAELMASDQRDFLLPIEQAVSMFQRIDLTDEQFDYQCNGVFFQKESFSLTDPNSLVAFFYQDLLVSLYGPHPDKSQYLKPVKVLRNDRNLLENEKEVRL